MSTGLRLANTGFSPILGQDSDVIMSPLTRNRKPSAWCAPCPRGGEGSSGSAQSRAPACGRARAGSASGRGAPTRRAAFGSLRRTGGGGAACGRVRPIPYPRGERRTTPKICRLTKAARCAILHSDGRRKFALRRPGIGAYAEISRAFRCAIGSLRPTGANFRMPRILHRILSLFSSSFGENPNPPHPAAPRLAGTACRPSRGGNRRPRGGAPNCTKSRDYPTNGSTLRHDFSVRKLYNICRKEEQPWNLSKT